MDRLKRAFHATSPEYKDWAEFQNRELKERAGDGYSPWEYVSDLPEAAYQNLNSWLNTEQNSNYKVNEAGTSRADSKMRELMDGMRKIRDAQKGNPKYQLSPSERAIDEQWRALLNSGFIAY